MRYKDLRFWDTLGKSCKIFLTSKIKENIQPLAKNLLIPLPPGKNSAPVDSTPRNSYLFTQLSTFNVMTQ